MPTNLSRILRWLACALAVALGPPAWAQESTPPPSDNAQAPALNADPAQGLGDGMDITFSSTAIWASIRRAFEKGDYLELVTILWRAQLFSVGGRAVELSQLVIALLFFTIGLFVARRIARLVEYRVSKVKRIPPSVPPMFNKLAFWFLIVMVVLITLSLAGIPLTVFAFLGGALAIGIGFGVQNLCNNLISGLIILTERPIRPGDIIEINGEAGRVDEVGNRCTRVHRFDGIDVLVPNSKFLEESVINWTLRDADIRGHVKFGVAYGSALDLTRQLIDRALKANTAIKTTPAPDILFTEFGDNALGFEVYFWTTVTKPMDLRHIESDLRFSIESLLEEHHIVMAFPQRDVHLDTASPLQVVLTRGSKTDTTAPRDEQGEDS